MNEISVDRRVDEFACEECVIQKDYLLKSPYYFYFIRVFELCVGDATAFNSFHWTSYRRQKNNSPYVDTPVGTI